MKLITQTKYRVLVAGFTLLLFAGTGFACGCDLPSAGKPFKRVVAEARNKSSAVFSGTVVAIDRKPGDLYVAVRFKLKEFWKGALSEEVIIFTGLGGGDCGYEFEVGQQYLVYAYRHKKNKLGTNICQRTNELLDAAQDLKVLGKGKLIGQRDRSNLSCIGDVSNEINGDRGECF